MTKKRLQGTVKSLMVGDKAETLVSTRISRVEVTFEGMVGDVHYGLTRLSDVRVPHYPRGTLIRNTRQISALSTEELAEIAGILSIPLVLPEWLGANLEFEGIPNLTLLPPSTRIFFPEDAVLVVDGENMPCTGPGNVLQDRYPDESRLVQRFPKAAFHRRGFVGWIERPGFISQGDVVEVLLPSQIAYSYSAAKA
ncbi:MAG TPA: hypothetical protein VFA41_19755 [Ktedonobacteraceae bacterium]|jgi:hypothetical protein|nr:hypothetical protein [Ktedonobacteraceae bacterium]